MLRQEVHQFDFGPLTQRFHGAIVRRGYRFAFVDHCQGADRVYCQIGRESSDLAQRLQVGTRVSYELRSNLRGLLAIALRLDD